MYEDVYDVPTTDLGYSEVFTVVHEGEPTVFEVMKSAQSFHDPVKVETAEGDRYLLWPEGELESV